MAGHVNLTLGVLLGDRYLVDAKLGQGGFGSVYSMWNIYTNATYALKVEREGKDALRNEFQVLSKVGGPGGVGPSVVEFWKLGNHSALTMDLKGTNLKNANPKGSTVSVGTVALLLVGMLGLLSRLHKAGYIHRDIKQQNVVYGNPEDPEDSKRLYLVDFGLASKYRGEDGKHLPLRRGVRPKGSYHYLSVWNHKMLAPSRRDDLESLAYTTSRLLKGRLPWSWPNKTRPGHAAAADIKLQLQEALFEGCPQEFTSFMQYIRGLGYYEKPDYKYWQIVFKNLSLQMATHDVSSPECLQPPGSNKQKVRKKRIKFSM